MSNVETVKAKPETSCILDGAFIKKIQ